MSLFNLFGFLGHSHTTTPTATTPSSNPVFDDANATNLVGLWDFASGAPTLDTGLADNTAQNGHLHGAHITGDRLVTDGYHDYFDVSGTDAPFDLDVGTIAVQFTQADHVGSSPDVIVNRGEFHDKSSEGWFGISVTHDGKVVIEHSPVGADATIQTATGFFNECDTVKVTYSWDAATGATALIENVSTGATFTDTIATTGLTMEIGDNDDENFTFGAREANEGSYDEFFKGSIDYVAIYNTDTIITPAGEGIVEGTDGNDLIDVNYNGDPDGDFIDNNDALIGNIGSNDDIVIAGAGDDTVLAGLGDDSVLGGSGDDTIDGGADDDLIYGDNGAQTTVGGGTPTQEGIADEGGVATLLVWDASQLSFIGGDPFPNGIYGLSTHTVDDITMTINTDATPVAVGINDGSSSHFNDGDLSQDLVNNETIDGITGAAGTRFTPEYAYSVVNDDTGETIKVYVVEMNSNQVVGFVSDAPMELGATYSFVSNISNHPSVSYGALADTYIDPNGGVVVVGASDDGDDDIDGGTGEDTIFGEGGKDTIDGGAGDDLIYGDNGSANPGGPVVGSPSLMDIDNLSGGILTSNDGSVSAQVALDDFTVVPAGTLSATSDVFYAERISGTDQATLSFDFQDDVQVQDVSFTLFDLNDGNNGSFGNWDDQVTIIALDENGQQVPVTFTGGNINVNGNTVESDSASGSAPLNGSNADNVEVSIQGPISSLQIIYENGPDNNVTGYLGVSDLSVTSLTPYDGGASGSGSNDDDDDLITGGDGEDTIFGEGGSDTIMGGNAGDVVDGGTEGSDVDVLDLRGEGPARIVNETTDADGDSTSGTVEFLDAAGNVTGSLEFTEIESVLLDPVDQTPVANDDALTIDEDSGPVTIDVLVNDTDPQVQQLTITDATVPANQGTVDIVGNQLVFTPADDFNGDATIAYIIEDTDQNPATAEVLVTVNPVNDAPIATDDDATTDFGTAVVISPLGNDSDPDAGDTVTISDASVPANQGSVTFDPVAGTLTFTPADDFEGDATITYEITDGDLTDTAEVTVTVGLDPADGIVDGLDTGEVMNLGYVDTQGDEIDGTDGLDDVIEGNGGDDTINAGAGDDTVSGGEDDDVIDGGVGEDVLVGDEGDDSLVGGDGADDLAGGADDDTLEGGLGDDVLSGDEGDDDLSGDAGEDTIAGGDGSDSVDGGAGDDVINSSIFGNIGTPDSGYPGVYAGDSDPTNDMDTVNGGAGNDVISTGDDADLIDGGTGNDKIDAGIDADTVDGGEGNDTIIGGEGADSILGGAGNDTIYAGNDPALGLDAFNIEDDGTNPLGPDLNVTNGQDTVSGGEGNDVIFGADDDDVLSGDAGNDTIDGGIDDDSIDGGTGDDVLIGGQGDDTIEGGAGEDDINGGIGNDVLSGGADADHFSGVNAGDTVIGGETGDDNDTLNLAGSVQPGGSYVIDYTPGTDDEDGVVNYFDDNGDAAGTLVFSEIETIIPCFTPGTLIATAKGERRVEDLVEGDRIITRDNGIQTIRWAGSREMTGAEFEQAAHLKPILIQQGALGGGLPERDMMVSPQHRLLVANDKTALYFEEREVLIAAKFLTDLEGIDVVDVSSTTYIHIMFDQHEVVLSDGTWTESFQPGDQTLAGISDPSRGEILELFPELATREGVDGYTSARRSLKKHEATLIAK